MWNYRVIRFKGEQDAYYELKEVFYNRDGSIMGYADATVDGESIDDIILTLKRMKESAKQNPIIDEEEFFKYAKEKDDE